MASFFTTTDIPSDQWVLLRSSVAEFSAILLNSNAVLLLVQAAADAAPSSGTGVDAVAGVPLNRDDRSYSQAYPAPQSVYARARYEGQAAKISHSGA
jgi:hypothetical protein